jgi:hypothetical protein
MSLFQLYQFIDDNNYDDDYMQIVESPEEYDIFQEMPESYVGTIEDWHKELDAFEEVAKEEALATSKELYVKILSLNRLE